MTDNNDTKTQLPNQNQNNASPNNDDKLDIKKSPEENKKEEESKCAEFKEIVLEHLEILKQVAFEFIATFMFVSCIYLSNSDVSVFIFGFWVILTVFAGYSGAHVNPAVTVGFYIYEGKFWKGLTKLNLYFGVQFSAAMLALKVSKIFIDDVFYVAPSDNISLLNVMFSEFFFTGTFVFVILFVNSEVTQPSKYAPINCGIIVAWFYMIVSAGEKISGAAYNPAVLWALNESALMTKADALDYMKYMITSEFVGAGVFTLIFMFGFELPMKNQQKLVKK